MFEKLKAIVVDDEPMAVKGLLKHLSNIKYIEVVGTCENAMDALELLNTCSVDLMFLDINMPKISGIQFLKLLKNKPITIITSAYPEYAVEGFELDVMDYLVKPISFERFLKATHKAKDYHDKVVAPKGEATTDTNDYLFIKVDKKIERIYFNDITYIESLHNYLAIYTDKDKFIAHLTLKSIEDKLPPEQFVKVQKSFIVSVSKITTIEDGEVMVSAKRISISRANKDEVMKAILGNKYLRR